MPNLRAIKRAIERRGKPNPAKRRRQQIDACHTAWQDMMSKMDAVVGWVRKHCTPQQVAVYEAWAKVGVSDKLSPADRKIFVTIQPPAELTEAARKAINTFDSYPQDIKAAVVAVRKAFNAL